MSAESSTLLARRTRRQSILSGLRTVVGRCRGGHGTEIEFHPELAILDCGEVQLAREYSVEPAGNQAVETIKNDPRPIVLRIAPSARFLALRISRSTDARWWPVADRKLAYARRTAMCSVAGMSANP